MSRSAQSPSQSHKPSTKSRKVFLWFTATFVGILALVVFPNTEVTANDSEGGNEKILTAAVAKAERKNLTKKIDIAADFIPYQEVEVQSKVPGYVKEISVDIGDHVTKGQVFATLVVPELEQDWDKAKSTVKRSRSEIDQIKSEIRKHQALAHIADLTYNRLAKVNVENPNLVAQQEIDMAHAKALAESAQLDAERKRLTVAKHQLGEAIAEEKRMRTMYEYSHITAPFDGVVTKRYVDVGTMVQQAVSSYTMRAEPLVEIAQVDLLRLSFPVPEPYMAMINKDMPVTVRVPALGKTFKTKIWRFASKAIKATRTMDTQILVENPDFEFKPGMVASVSLDLQFGHDTLAVPVEAVKLSPAEAVSTKKTGTVLVVTPDNQVQTRKVTLGFDTATEYQVLSGLSENEQVIIAGLSQFQDGQKVTPKLVTFKQIAQ